MKYFSKMRSIQYIHSILIFSSLILTGKGKTFERKDIFKRYGFVQRYKRNVWETHTWPNREVPFTVSSSFPQTYFPRICKAMVDIELHSCIKFVPIPPQSKSTSFVFITNDNPGCFAQVGYDKFRKKPSLLNYSKNCFHTRGVIEHEMLHILGLFHEQSRPDRDKYLNIYIENILPDKMTNFDLELNTTTYGLPYDYDSVMHYGTRSFTRNGKPTMLPKEYPDKIVGQRQGPTRYDFLKIYIMYRCNETGLPVISEFKPAFDAKMDQFLSLKRDPNFDKYIQSLLRNGEKDENDSV